VSLNKRSMPSHHRHIWQKRSNYTDDEFRCFASWEGSGEPCAYYSQKAASFCGATAVRISYPKFLRTVSYPDRQLTPRNRKFVYYYATPNTPILTMKERPSFYNVSKKALWRAEMGAE